MLKWWLWIRERHISADNDVSPQELDGGELHDVNSAAPAISDDDNDDHDNDDQCPEKFTEYFALKGSSYHEDCQKALKKCKQLHLNKQGIEMQAQAYQH